MVAEQLLERFEFQKTALAKQFPFMAQNNLWKGLGEKNADEEVGDAINTGSLSIGFVGGANAMYALFGQEHSESKEAIVKTVKNINSHKPFALYPADFIVIGKVIPDRSEKRNINGTLIVIKFFINITSFRFIIKMSYSLK